MTFFVLPEFAKRLFCIFEKINIGSIEISLSEYASPFIFKGVHRPEEIGVIQINELAGFCKRIIARGELGLGESYMLGEWSSPNLEKVLEILCLNREYLENKIHLTYLKRIVLAYIRWWTQGTKAQAFKNVQVHYDLSNQFYQYWLDKSMTYSCAWFKGGKDISLEEAQKNKHDRVLERIGAKQGDQILDIGCGWGAFAEEAANRGCYVTGITLSREQYEYALERAKIKKMTDLMNFRLQDYRDIHERYDCIVSIGMFEHVGGKYYSQFFKKIYDCLKPKGKALLHTIVVGPNDQSLMKRNKSNWLNTYIFPGGEVPMPNRIRSEAAKASLTINNEFAFGHDYASTLSFWEKSFQDNWPKIQSINAQTFNENFKRYWEYYLNLCIGIFRGGICDVMQFELQKT